MTSDSGRPLGRRERRAPSRRRASIASRTISTAPRRQRDAVRLPGLHPRCLGPSRRPPSRWTSLACASRTSVLRAAVSTRNSSASFVGDRRARRSHRSEAARPPRCRAGPCGAASASCRPSAAPVDRFGGVVLAPALGDGPVHHRADALVHAASPSPASRSRSASAPSSTSAEVTSRHRRLAEVREGVGLRACEMNCVAVLGVAPRRQVRLVHGASGFREGHHRGGLALRRSGSPPARAALRLASGELARLGQRHQVGGAEAYLPRPSVDHDALHPAPGRRWLRREGRARGRRRACAGPLAFLTASRRERLAGLRRESSAIPCRPRSVPRPALDCTGFSRNGSDGNAGIGVAMSRR